MLAAPAGPRRLETAAPAGAATLRGSRPRCTRTSWSAWSSARCPTRPRPWRTWACSSSAGAPALAPRVHTQQRTAMRAPSSRCRRCRQSVLTCVACHATLRAARCKAAAQGRRRALPRRRGAGPLRCMRRRPCAHHRALSISAEAHGVHIACVGPPMRCPPRRPPHERSVPPRRAGPGTSCSSRRPACRSCCRWRRTASSSRTRCGPGPSRRAAQASSATRTLSGAPCAAGRL
jgi:hypothetical protein